MLVNILPPPGFFDDLTDLDAGPKWVRGDKVRFHLGRLQKIGGWQRVSDDQFLGKARYLLTFQDLDLNQLIWLGTHLKVYVYQDGYVDITPLDESGTYGANPLRTNAIGTSTMRITDVGHGRAVGDYVVIGGGPHVVDGVTIANGEYTVQTVDDADHFRIQGTGSAIAGNTAGGGGGVTFEYLLTIGREYATFSGGWGSSTYGTGSWGSPRTGSTYAQPSIWSADNWGEDVIANRRRGGFVYYWDTSGGLSANRMTIIEADDASGAGTGDYPRANSVAVAPERLLILFGSEDTIGSGDVDPLLIRWSDRENYSIFEESDTNLAGSFRLQAGNEILSAERTKQGYVVLTDATAHYMQFLGFPFVYGFTQLGTNCGVIGPNASAEYNGTVYWMGANKQFYRFDGQLQVMPCSLQRTVFDDINGVQAHLISCGINAEWNEVIWFYPDTTNTENTKYIKYNWLYEAWDMGSMERTAWVDRVTFRNPIAADNDGRLHFHEAGSNDHTSNIYSWAETGEFQLADGDRMIFMDTIIPDLDITGTVDFTIKTKRYPSSSEEFVKGPYTVTPTTEKVKMRARGRAWAVKVESNGDNYDFNMGKTRVNIQPDGER